MNEALKPEQFVVEIEQELLGELLMGRDFRRIQSFLRREHFLEWMHGIIFDAIEAAWSRYGNVNPIIVRRLIPERDKSTFEAMAKVAVSEYLANLAANCISYDVERTARKVVEQWARVSLAMEAEGIAASAWQPTSDPLAVISGASQAFDEISSEIRITARKRTRHSLDDALDDALADTQEAMQRGSGMTGITWGLKDINRLTGGLQRRELALLAGRPGMGKTSVALSSAWKMARAGHGVGIVSLEMDAVKLAMRTICDMAYDRVKVPYADMIKGSVSTEQFETIQSLRAEWDSLPLWIEDQAGLSMHEIRTKAELLKAGAEKAGVTLDVLVIDHIGLIAPSSRYAGSRVNEIAEISGGLKVMAREFDIAVLALSQLNRALENRDNKRPQLSDLRDSGAIEQDADFIGFLYRDAYYLEREKSSDPDRETERLEKLIERQNKLEFNIAKQRNGPLAAVELFADRGCAAVRDGAWR